MLNLIAMNMADDIARIINLKLIRPVSLIGMESAPKVWVTSH